MKMNNIAMKKILAMGLAGAMIFSMAACGTKETTEAAEDVTEEVTEVVQEIDQEMIVTTANVTSDGAIDASGLFTERDLTQTADLTDAEYYTLQDGQDIEITSAGVYVLSGTATDVTIKVNAGDEDKVQIVLNGVNITNSDSPAIYVVNADKVFVTTTDTENTLSVTGTFAADGDTNTDAAIFSKDDLILNGVGTLNISSTANGVTSKDDLKITGGNININCEADAMEANESVAIADGNITIVTNKDGIHAEYDEDDTVGYVYICGGNIKIEAADDGIHGTTIVQIDGGTFDIDTYGEGIEATIVQINGGTVDVYAADDGINASAKSSAYYPELQINGGDVTISMGQGDTDALDSNGALTITGGTINITAQSPFDYDGTGTLSGGTVIVNGQEVTQLSNQMMGGGMMGGQMGGGPGGMGEGFGGPGFGG